MFIAVAKVHKFWGNTMENRFTPGSDVTLVSSVVYYSIKLFLRFYFHYRNTCACWQDRAATLPLLLDTRQRRYFYINNNNKVEDFAAEYKTVKEKNIWTKAEEEIFKENFIKHFKQFDKVASFLANKSTGDCVQYYYQSKKENNYKELVRRKYGFV